MHQQNPSPRAAHPVLPDLVGGIELTPRFLEERKADAEMALAKMLSNAEYWLSFDMAHFEPLLAKSPSPLRELGVAVALRFSEQMHGELALADIEQARAAMVPGLSDDLRAGIENGLATLCRAVTARDGVARLLDAGFTEYSGGKGTSVHALRAMGKSNIDIEGHPHEKRLPVPLGEPLVLSATDERGRPLDAPDVESRIGAPMLIKDEENRRTVLFYVPGEYQLRVPGKATGDRKVVAS